ncbi:Hypothetical Protein FCC1311_040552 [Hondaea fermentalgiana]|uniref:Uncharacterized protein n=1 Tax=Hondaea fermentalgiana TaxID=2315210 RepID=A0A2R5G9V4_9STRA|nr:Hypothetical Protein FCC1311_040552 [Hondaea fermentalgiana]|eukprot:GBG27832.1 Hypothetical Protein FCC1311_040552 [Hondaea fermentalgiana]
MNARARALFPFLLVPSCPRQTRKQIREEFHRANDELGGSHHDLLEENQGTDEEGDEEVDDNDLNYGVDPVITDINEELRVIEGMISEHTKLREIEVDDDGDDEDDDDEDDDDEDDDDDVNLPEAPQPIRLPPPAKSNIAKALEKAEAQSLSSRRGPRSPRSGSPRGSSGLAKGSLVAATGTSASDSQGQSAAPSSANPPRAPGTAEKDSPAVTAQVVPTPSNEDGADPKFVIPSTGAPADPKTVFDTLGKLALESSSAGEKQGEEDAATKQQTTQPSSTPARVLETGSSGEKASEGGAVRMVELPDYLAMIAREHKQQLLEKQRLELAKAAEAVNRAEAAESGAAKTPRSEVMIRRGYLDRLGFAGSSAPLSHSPGATRMTKGIDMGINARRAAIASARTRSKPPSLRVQLREAPSSSKSKGFFKKIASWIASDEGQSTSDASAGAGASGGLTQISSSLDSASSGGSFNSPALGPKSRRVNFKETADVYYIPARSDFPAKVKNAIWHTRAEFVEMVMTNMDQLELEMQQEAEAQRRIQDLRNNPPPSYNKNRASKDKSASGDPAAKS